MSTFVSHIVAELSPKALPADAPTSSTVRVANQKGTQVQISATHTKEALRGLFVQLDQSQSSPQALRECIAELQRLEDGQQLLSAELADHEEVALRRAVLGRVAVGLYGQALATFLEEAGEAGHHLEAEEEAEAAGEGRVRIV